MVTTTAGVKISELPSNTAALLTDLVPAVQGGVTYQETLSEILALFQSGLTNKVSVLAASTTALTVTYNNNGNGVGATLTNAGAQAVFTIDGVTPSVNDRILIKDQASAFQNGIYIVTNVGSLVTNWVLTRATDFDGSPAGEISQGSIVGVSTGTLNGATSWIETGPGPFTVGVTNIVFTIMDSFVGGNLTDGQVFIGSTGLPAVAATLTPGPGISIANGPGSITISGTGSGIGWSEVTAATQAITADNGYVANRATLITFSLPTTAAFGTAISLIGKGAGLFTVTQAANQQIHIGSSATTVGVAGSISSTNQFDSITLICTVANLVWTCLGGPQGAFTVA